MTLGGEMGQGQPKRPILVGEARFWPGYLGRAAQVAMLDEIRAVVRNAPLYTPVTAFGRKMSVGMTAAGKFGWYSDRKGYRYIDRHPDGGAWPPIPATVLAVWEAVAATARAPECCLINHYAPTARMGLHQDRDEADFGQPVVSISLGDDALFRLGGTEKGKPTLSLWLRSGDVLVLDGAARLAFHGIDRIAPGASDLLKEPGRINLTLRVVT